MSAVEIDLSVVSEMLDRAKVATKNLDGISLDDDRMGSAENRRVTVQLNFLADQLELCAALVRAEYWNIKGIS